MRSVDIPLPARGHAAPITHVDIRCDGRRLATSSYDGTVLIWDLTGPTAPRRIARLDHRRLVNAAGWNPCAGDLLATASADKTVIVWNVADDGRTSVVNQLSRHTDDINSVAWLPDGERLACVSEDGRATLWDALAGRLLGTLASHAAHCMSVAASSTGLVVTVGEDGLVQLVDPDSGAGRRTRHYDASVEGCAWSADGARLAIARDDGHVDILDADLNTLESLRLSSSAVRAVSWSACGAYLAVGSYDGRVSLVDGEQYAVVRTLRNPRMWPRSVAFGDKLLAVGSFGSMPHLIEVPHGAERDAGGRPTHGINALASHDRTLHVGCDSGAVLSVPFSGGNGAVQIRTPTSSPILSLATGGSTLYAGTYSGHVLRVADDVQALSEPCGAPVPSLLWHNDHVLAGTYQGELLTLEPAGLTLVDRARPHDGSIKSLAPLGDAGFVSGATDRIVAAGDHRDRQPLWQHGNLVNAVATLRSEVVASASRDRTVRVGRLREHAGRYTLTDLRILQGPDESIKAVALAGHPERPVVVAGSYDFGVHAWTVDWTGDPPGPRGGDLVLQLDQAVSAMLTIAPDLVAVAGWDGTLTLIEVDAGGRPSVVGRHHVDDLAEQATEVSA